MNLHNLTQEVISAGSAVHTIFGGKWSGGYYLQQNPIELASLVAFLAGAGPFERYLEIGVAAAGTTRFIFEHVPIAEIILIDDGLHEHAGYCEQNLAQFRDRVTLLRGNSHSIEIFAALATHLAPDKKLDIVFIDGDHSVPGVTSDINLVREYCHANTLLVFHDIYVTITGVPEVWTAGNGLKKVLAIGDSRTGLGIGIANLIL